MAYRCIVFTAVAALSGMQWSCGNSISSSLSSAQAPGETRALVHYGERTIDLDQYFAGYWPRGMVNQETEELFWIKSTGDGEMLLRQPGDEQSRSQSTMIMDFGKRSFSTPFYHALTKSFYFISDTKNAEDYNIHHYDPQDPQKISKLTSHVLVRNVQALPDQEELFLVYRDGPSGSPVCVGAISAREPRTERAIYCDGGHTADYTISDFTPPLLSPNGLEVALVLNRKNDRSDTHLAILDLVRGELRVVTNYSIDDKRNKVLPFGWVGNTIYFLEQNTKREVLVSYDTVTKVFQELDHLAGTAPEGGQDGVYDPKSGYLIYMDYGHEETSFRIFDPKQGRVLNNIPLGDYTFLPQRYVTTASGKFIFGVRHKSRPGSAFLSMVPAEGENAKISVFFDAAGNNPPEKSCPTETVYYPTFDKLPDGSPRLIEGILFKPFDDRKPTAALIYAHGGPTSRTTTAWSLESQIFCHLGYPVFAPNPRGSSGFGKEFENLNDFDWGGGDYLDYEYGRRYIAARYGLSDDRIGIYGESYGGYMTNLAVTKADSRFGFGLATMGIADLATTVRDSVVGQFLRGEIGDPETHVEFYRERSPIFFADNLHVPLLLVHGETDNRVPTKESQRFYAKLKELGKDVQYVEIPDEGHGFRYMSNVKLYMQASLDFLRRVAPID